MKKLLLLLFIVGLLSSCASFKKQSGYPKMNTDWKIRKL
jgi:hypothetical protein